MKTLNFNLSFDTDFNAHADILPTTPSLYKWFAWSKVVKFILKFPSSTSNLDRSARHVLRIPAIYYPFSPWED